MNRVYQVGLLCYVGLIIFVLLDISEADNRQSTTTYCRQRRYLSFMNTSNFFIRLNWKANMVPWNQIFAQALGFRVNWDDPPDTFRPYHRLYRRTVYTNMEELLDKNGFKGFHCVRRAICDIRSIDEPRSVYHKILKIIFRRQSAATDKWHSVSGDDCDRSTSQCPFSVLDVSLYTDL